MCMNWISRGGEKTSKPKGGAYIAVYPSRNKNGGELSRTQFSLSKEFMVDARLLAGDRVSIGYDGKKFGLRKDKKGFKLCATTKGATGTTPVIVSAGKILTDDRIEFEKGDVTFAQDGMSFVFAKTTKAEVIDIAANQ